MTMLIPPVVLTVTANGKGKEWRQWEGTTLAVALQKDHRGTRTRQEFRITRLGTQLIPPDSSVPQKHKTNKYSKKHTSKRTKQIRHFERKRKRIKRKVAPNNIEVNSNVGGDGERVAGHRKYRNKKDILLLLVEIEKGFWST